MKFVLVKLLAASLVIHLVLSPPATSNEPAPLHWGYVHFPPYYFEKEPGVAAGDLATLLARLMHDLGREYNGSQYPNRRMISLLNEGELDLALVMSSVLEQPQWYHRSANPITTMELAVYWRAGKTPVQQLADLYNSRLIVMTGFSYGGLREKIEPGYGLIRQLIEIEQHRLGMDALQLYRGDYLLNYRHAMPADSEQQLQFQVISRIEVFLWLRKSVADSDKLIQQIDALLASYALEAQNSLAKPSDK
ncbi:substrate-binding periplasmic protein [Arsukibacterium sp.]|uniref:substrate-binding periplasmic protein n=1 Tax=Arsukibacterium sp. TaxID=1977258 RepID=UPI002FDAEC54